MPLQAKQLESAGFEIETLNETIAVMPFGGRIIGLYPDGETNLLWVNPDALREGQCERWRDGADWPNQGGERLWISPEIDSNVGDPARFAETYAVPRPLDPGEYAWSRENGVVLLSAEFRLRWQRAGREVVLRTRRRVRAIDHPPVERPDGVLFAGYRHEQELALEGDPEGARPGLWSILQVPGGGTILAAVHDREEPTAFIGEPEWAVEDGRVRTRARTGASFKWSLRASQCRGRLVYMQDLDDARASLLVRCFPVGRDEEYADCPAFAPEETGHMCQVYVDDGALGGFGEMEYHAPAIDASGTTQTEAENWGFIGPREAVRELAKRLSGD